MANQKKRKTRTLKERLSDEQTRLSLAEAKYKRKIIKTRTALLSTHGAAAKNRLTSDWTAKKQTADQIMVTDVETLNNRARQLARDNWIIASALRSFKRSVVGTGITPVSVARDPGTGEAFSKFNKGLDRSWNRWARTKAFCDIERQKNFRTIENLLVSELVIVGEAFCILSYIPQENRVGLVLQMAEAEQLDMTLTKNPDNGNDVRGGVEIDSYGAPLAYWFVSSTNYGYSMKSLRVEARRVLHVFDQDRVRQTRGVTRMAPVGIKTRHLEMYDQYTIVKARMEACHVAAIQRDLDADAVLPGLAPDTSDGETGTDSRGSDEYIMEPGGFIPLAPGEKIEFNNPQSPGNQYDPFVKAQVSQIAAAMGLDFASIARDYSRGNFSSQRQGMLECYKETDAIQLLIIDDFCRPVREAFKMYAIMQGLVEAPGFFDSPETMEAYLEDEWRGPAKPWIDPLKEVNAAAKAIDYRLATRGGLLNEKGTDVGTVLRQTKDEQEQAKQLELYLPDAQANNTPTEKTDASKNEEQESENSEKE